MFSVEVQYEDRKARRWLDSALRALRLRGVGPLGDKFRAAGVRYFRFIRDRFRLNSAGQGDWLPLAQSTLQRKAGKKLFRAHGRGRFGSVIETTGEKNRAKQVNALVSGASVPILVDTGALYRTLTPGNQGNILRVSRDGVECGSTDPKIGFHQSPSVPGRPPQREVFVPPDEPTAAEMENEFADGFLAVVQAGQR